MTGNEETNCALLKARLVDDLFQWLLMALEDEGELEKTVIIGITDHYTYGYKNEKSLLELSGVEEKLLLEKTPCFIWSADLNPVTVDKPLNTADFLPTVLNLLGVETEYSYLGRDAFDETYEGYVLFSDGSWISDGVVCSVKASGKTTIIQNKKDKQLTQEYMTEMAEKSQQFIHVSNLLLISDYYKNIR